MKMPYLVSDHDVGDFSLAVDVFVLLLVREHGQHKVTGLALTLSHQKAARFSFLSEQLFCIPP